jgi:hypothetical protein
VQSLTRSYRKVTYEKGSHNYIRHGIFENMFLYFTTYNFAYCKGKNNISFILYNNIITDYYEIYYPLFLFFKKFHPLSHISVPCFIPDNPTPLMPFLSILHHLPAGVLVYLHLPCQSQRILAYFSCMNREKLLP